MFSIKIYKKGVLHEKTNYANWSPSVLEGVKQACGGSEPMAYWIIWKYAPDQLSEPCKDFAELREKHNCFDRITEEYANKYIYSDRAQAGAKYLLRRLDAKRDIDLYNRYYELAMGGDVQALKAYMDFKKNFFGKGENDELQAILAGARTSVDTSDIDDFEISDRGRANIMRTE